MSKLLNKFKSDKIINKDNISKKSSDKIKYFSAKNVFPYDNTFNEQLNNSNNKEENIIASILQTNNMNTSNNKETDINNPSIKYNKKSSSSLINLFKDYKEIGDFSFISISEKMKPFLYEMKKNKECSNFEFNNYINKINTYKMIIKILVDDDSLYSSNNLINIFDSIKLSLNSLGEINISKEDILVCIFFQHFSYEESFKKLFPGLILKKKRFYCSYGDVFTNSTTINTLLIYKEGSTFIEVSKFFYSNILNDLKSLINADIKEIGKTFLVVNWPNGKTYKKTSNKYHKSRILANIFRITNNRNMILIPDINYTPFWKKDYFGHLLKYSLDLDKIYINFLWGMMCRYPIDHRFFLLI